MFGCALGSTNLAVISVTLGRREQFGMRIRFSVGQKWRNNDAIFGPFFGEVIEIYGRGRRGIVVITDDQGNVLDTFSGSAAAFQSSGEWQLIEE